MLLGAPGIATRSKDATRGFGNKRIFLSSASPPIKVNQWKPDPESSCSCVDSIGMTMVESWFLG